MGKRGKERLTEAETWLGGKKEKEVKKRAKENKGKNCKKLNDFSYSKIQFVL